MGNVTPSAPRYTQQEDDASALVWPRGLILPSHGVNLVYLDLNHWISLAQASVGHSKGDPFVATLKACRIAKSTGKALFVLSATHYMEVEIIKNPERRSALACVMEELTDFASIVDRATIMELELATMLAEFTLEPILKPVVQLLGKSVLHSLGRHDGIKIMGPDGDATDSVRQEMGSDKFDRLVGEASLGLNRSVLRGPVGTESEQLRALGWRPEAAAQCAEKRASQERELTPLLAQETDSSLDRLRDKVAARELCIEFQDILPRALAYRRIPLTAVVPDRESAPPFVRAMPSTEVSIELKTAWHRNPSKSWSANDIFDIDAMSLAVPYCDIVLPDKEYHHALTAAGLGERMNTTIVRNLENLPEILSRRQTKHCPDASTTPSTSLPASD